MLILNSSIYTKIPNVDIFKVEDLYNNVFIKQENHP